MSKITLSNGEYCEVMTKHEPTWISRDDWCRECVVSATIEASVVIHTADPEQLAAIQAVLRVGTRAGYRVRHINPHPGEWTLEIVSVPTDSADLFGIVTAVQVDDMGGFWRIEATIAREAK